MHPRTPEILSRLIGLADAMVRAQDEGRWRTDLTRGVALGQVYGELATLRRAPTDTEAGFDDAALMLNQCLILLDRDAGPAGDTLAATKWTAISKLFLPFVRADLARAIEASAHPATSDHDFGRKKA